jgi:lambda family phage tail tape measure protein
MANIARLGVVLGLNTAEFTQGVERAKKGSESLKSQLTTLGTAALAATTALGYMVKQSINSMDALAKQAQMAGVTVESLSKLAYAAKLADVSQQELVGSMARLAKGMGEASQGTGEALKAFTALQLDPATFKGTDDALTQIAEKLSQFEDGAEKTALAIALFGRSGAKLLPLLNSGAKGFAEAANEAENFGIVVSTKAAKEAEQFNDNLTRLNQVSEGWTITLAEKLLPTLNNIVEKILSLNNILGKPEVQAFFTGSAFETANIEKAQQNVYYLTGLVESLQDKLSQDGGSWFDKYFASQSLAANLEKLDQATKLLDKLKKEVKPEEEKITKPPAPKLVGGKTDSQREAEKIEKMIESARKLSDEFNRSQEFNLKMQKSQEAMLGLTTDQQTIQGAYNEVLKSTNQQLEKIVKLRMDAVNAGANADVLRQFDVESQAIQELGEGWASLAKIQAEESVAAQRTFSYGWNTAFAQYAEDAENYANQARDMFSAVTGAMSSAINEFVETGKFSFKDFAGSVIKDLIKIQLQAQATALFNTGLKAVMGAFSGGIGGATTIGSGSLAGGAGALSFPVRANGGTVSADSPYMVGERGAELFVPGRSGTVIPNNNLGGLGGTTNITNNYIDAIDTKSFEDRIYGSSRAVWSANQFASKSISNNRSRT